MDKKNGQDFGISETRFAFDCASAGIVAIMGEKPDSDPTGDVPVLENDEDVTIEPPKQYCVIVLDDDYTPMGFVVELLQNVFRMDLQAAAQKTYEIHMNGKAVCGTYPCDIARAKAEEVVTIAQKAGHPLAADYKPA